MTSEQKITAVEQPRRSVFKAIQWVLIVLSFIFLLLFFGVPLFLSSSGGTGFLLGHINNSVDGQVRMDDFSIGWLKGVRLTNLSYADSVGSTSVTVERIETQPKYLSLLGGKVKLGKTVVEQPRIYMKVPTEQETPTEAPKAQTPPATSPTKTPVKSDAPPPIFPIHQIDLELINGSATIELTGDRPQKVSFANIASRVQVADAGKPSSIDLSMDIDETSNVSVKGAATPSKKGWTLEDADFNVQISKLQLASLKPLFALAGQEMDISGEVNADAMVKIGGGTVEQIEAHAVITDLAQGAGEQRIVFDQPITVTAAVAGSGQDIQIETFSIQSQFCNVDCDGTAESLNYAVDADLGQTQRVVGQFADMDGFTMQGNLTANGIVSMTDQMVKAAGKGSIEKLVVKKADGSTPMTDAHMDFDFTVDQVKKQLRLSSANLMGTPGTVKIANLVLPMGDEADKTISLDARATLDLAKTWAFAQVLTELPEGLQLAGMLDSAVKVSTQGSSTQILTDKTQITQLKITQPDSAPFVQEKVSLNADVVLDTDAQTIDVRRLNMEAADGQSLIKITKGQVEKRISNNTTTLSGDFQAQYDLKTVSAFASAYLPEGLVLEGQRSDFLHFKSQYPTNKPDLMMANLDANSALGFNKAQYLGLNFGPTELKLNVNQGQAVIDMPDADVNGGKVRFAGNINLTEEPMVLRLHQSEQATQVVENVEIDDVISATLLQYLNPVFAKGTNVTGTANLSCSTLAIPLGGGTPNDIHLVGSVGLTDVHLNSPLLGLFKEAMGTEGLDLFSIPPSLFTVKDGLVEYADMPMEFGSDFALHFGGAIGLDKSLAMNIKAPIKDKTYNVALGGTLDRPELDLTKLILNNITEQIPIEDEKTREAVEKGLELLEGIFK